jgi:hypothetical protein
LDRILALAKKLHRVDEPEDEETSIPWEGLLEGTRTRYLGYAKAALDHLTNNRPQFPILGSGGAKIDFQLVADHGKQANRNHYQTVETLAVRGGLSWAELYAVLHNQEYKNVDSNEAMIACRALEARYLAAVQ